MLDVLLFNPKAQESALTTKVVLVEELPVEWTCAQKCVFSTETCIQKKRVFDLMLFSLQVD